MAPVQIEIALLDPDVIGHRINDISERLGLAMEKAEGLSSQKAKKSFEAALKVSEKIYSALELISDRFADLHIGAEVDPLEVLEDLSDSDLADEEISQGLDRLDDLADRYEDAVLQYEKAVG